MGFSSTDIDPEDDDKLAAVYESWQASIARQAQLLFQCAISAKRNELLQRRKDGSIITKIRVSELAALENAEQRETQQHIDAREALRRRGDELQARLDVSTSVLSADLAALEDRYADAMRVLTSALRERGLALEEEQSRSAAMVERLRQEEAAADQLELRAMAAEARAASLGKALERAEESGARAIQPIAA